MKRLLGFTTVLLMIAGCGGGGKVLSLYGVVDLELQEYESRTIAVRYVDEDGYPIHGGRVRFAMDSEDAAGAVLETVVAVCDEQGVAQTVLRAAKAASFELKVNADDAEELTLDVSISNKNGGELNVTVFNQAKADIEDVQVTLVDDIPCATFNASMMPPEASNIDRARQDAQPKEEGDEVEFKGLVAGREYAVVAVGTADGGEVAQGCRGKLKLTKEEIERGIPLNVNIFLQDIKWVPKGNVLWVETDFNRHLYLRRISNLLRAMSDHDNDPVDFLIDRAMASDHGNDFWKAILARLFKNKVKDYFQINSRTRGRDTIVEVAQELEDISENAEIKLFTMLDIEDEQEGADGEPVDLEGDMAATHRFAYFSVERGGDSQQYELQTSRGITGKAIDESKLEAQTTVTVTDASEIFINEHTLFIPVADAIVGTLLMDHFQEYTIELMFAQMIECYDFGRFVEDHFHAENCVPSAEKPNQYDCGSWAYDLMYESIAATAETVCHKVITNLAKEAYDDVVEDIKEVGLNEEMLFEGKAKVTKHNDNSIKALKGGEWRRLGGSTFTAERYR